MTANSQIKVIESVKNLRIRGLNIRFLLSAVQTFNLAIQKFEHQAHRGLSKFGTRIIKTLL